MAREVDQSRLRRIFQIGRLRRESHSAMRCLCTDRGRTFKKTYNNTSNSKLQHKKEFLLIKILIFFKIYSISNWFKKTC